MCRHSKGGQVDLPICSCSIHDFQRCFKLRMHFWMLLHFKCPTNKIHDIIVDDPASPFHVRRCRSILRIADCATALLEQRRSSYDPFSLHCSGPPSPPPPLPIDSKTPSLPSYFPSSFISVCPLPFVFIFVSRVAFAVRDDDADSICNRKSEAGKFCKAAFTIPATNDNMKYDRWLIGL